MNKFLNYPVVSLLVLCLILSSCEPVLYIPNVPNTPMFEKAGDFQLGGHFGTSGFDVQTAFAPSENLAFIINGSVESKDIHLQTGNDAIQNEHIFGEAGLGYYIKFGETGIYEGFFGYGIGHTKDLKNNISGDFARYFIQNDIGLSNDIFQGCISLRLSNVSFYTTSDSWIISQDETLNNFYIEPSIIARLRFNNIRFQYRLGASLAIRPQSIVGFRNEPLAMSFGLIFHINTFGSKDQSQ